MSYALYITNKTERSRFKSGCVIQVMKHLKEDWIVYSVAVLITA